MNRLSRLLAILTLLQSKRHTTAEAIAEHFGISVRTVYRDIKALGEQGAPVGFEVGKGYFLVQGYFLPPVQFSSEEANALLLMESVVSGFADKGIQRHYTTALNKVKAVLRNKQKEELEVLNNHIMFQVPECFKYDQEYLSTLQSAIGNRHILELQYETKGGETSQRQVEPIGLVFYALAWHLIAWCHLRNDYRDFRVSRIQKMRCLDIPFKKQEHIALSEFVKEIHAEY
jgi:predicted DNA-binding transcriptional regulator YafY